MKLPKSWGALTGGQQIAILQSVNFGTSTGANYLATLTMEEQEFVKAEAEARDRRIKNSVPLGEDGRSIFDFDLG
jgi:hypothetical protein